MRKIVELESTPSFIIMLISHSTVYHSEKYSVVYWDIRNVPVAWCANYNDTTIHGSSAPRHVNVTWKVHTGWRWAPIRKEDTRRGAPEGRTCSRPPWSRSVPYPARCRPAKAYDRIRIQNIRRITPIDRPPPAGRRVFLSLCPPKIFVSKNCRTWIYCIYHAARACSWPGTASRGRVSETTAGRTVLTPWGRPERWPAISRQTQIHQWFGDVELQVLLPYSALQETNPHHAYIRISPSDLWAPEFSASYHRRYLSTVYVRAGSGDRRAKCRT